MKIIRYTPRTFNQVARNDVPTAGRWTLALDVVETEEAILVQASVPGVRPEDIEVTLEDDVLTIAGERPVDETIKANDYHLRERWAGQFRRSLRLNVPVDREQIEAAYNNGVLTLTLPKAEEVKPRKIAIQVK